MPAKFQRRHYETIAAALRTARKANPDIDPIDAVEIELCKQFREDNANFNWDTFRAACQPDTDYRNRSI